MTAATELSHKHPRLKIVQQGDSISIEVPLNFWNLLLFLLMLLLVAVGWYEFTGRVSVVGVSLPLYWVFPAFFRERIELRPDGLCIRMQSERTQKTLPWEPITRIQAGGGKSRTVRFEYEGAPYLGSQFQIGWNLTHEESEAIARLITDYRASHLTA